MTAEDLIRYWALLFGAVVILILIGTTLRLIFNGAFKHNVRGTLSRGRVATNAAIVILVTSSLNDTVANLGDPIFHWANTPVTLIALALVLVGWNALDRRTFMDPEDVEET